MKKTLYILLLLSVTFASCVQDVDDVYDKPVSIRVEEAVQEYHDLLVSSEHGWLMEYYPHSKQQYGGYLFVMKFEQGDKVTVSTDAFGDSGETAESLFSIKKDIGPTLNFDSYNELFHYFSDPDFAIGAGTGNGLEGDYEFLLRSHTENEIILRGKKTKNYIRMTRLTESATPLLASAIKIDQEMAALQGVLGFSGMVDGKKFTAVYDNQRKFTVTYDGKSTSVPFLMTDTGIQFYQPFVAGGIELHRFAWSATEETLTAEDGSGVVLTADYDPEYPAYAQYLGTYTMIYKVGNTEKRVPIELIQKVYKESFDLKGLPFALTITYNKDQQCMELLTQNLQDGSGAYVAAWEVTNTGRLWNKAGLGLYSVLREGTDNTYDFVDNGAWEDVVVKGIILWSSGGEYKAYGDSRFTYISFVKD